VRRRLEPRKNSYANENIAIAQRVDGLDTYPSAGESSYAPFDIVAHALARLQDQRWQDTSIAHAQKPVAALQSHRVAAVIVGRSDTVLGAFYQRPAGRIGNPKAVTARKIAVLFYNAMRYGMDYRNPGADHYEQQYRDHIIKHLHRRPAQFGYSLQPQDSLVLR
jgi:hypothetical protein